MTITSIRQKLVNYMNVVDDKKLKAIYALVEDELERDNAEYPAAFKKELDQRYEYYKNGGKMISASAADKKISNVLARKKK